MTSARDWAAAVWASRECGRLDPVAEMFERGLLPPPSARDALVALFRKARLWNTGRTEKRINGHTLHNINLADAFQYYHAQIAAGHDDFVAADSTCKKFLVTPNVLAAVIAKRRTDVNVILRERGILEAYSKKASL